METGARLWQLNPLFRLNITQYYVFSLKQTSSQQHIHCLLENYCHWSLFIWKYCFSLFPKPNFLDFMVILSRCCNYIVSLLVSDAADFCVVCFSEGGSRSTLQLSDIPAVHISCFLKKSLLLELISITFRSTTSSGRVCPLRSDLNSTPKESAAVFSERNTPRLSVELSLSGLFFSLCYSSLSLLASSVSGQELVDSALIPLSDIHTHTHTSTSQWFYTTSSVML